MANNLEVICGAVMWNIAWISTIWLLFMWLFNTVGLPEDHPGRKTRWLVLVVVCFAYVFLVRWLALGPVILYFAAKVAKNRIQDFEFVN